jgi:hypothetical protein
MSITLCEGGSLVGMIYGLIDLPQGGVPMECYFLASTFVSLYLLFQLSNSRGSLK